MKQLFTCILMLCIGLNSFALDENLVKHFVTSGQTVFSLAKYYNTTVDEIYNLNPEVKQFGLKANRYIKVKKGSVPPESSSQANLEIKAVRTKEVESSIATSVSAEDAIANSLDEEFKFIYEDQNITRPIRNGTIKDQTAMERYKELKEEWKVDKSFTIVEPKSLIVNNKFYEINKGSVTSLLAKANSNEAIGINIQLILSDGNVVEVNNKEDFIEMLQNMLSNSN